MQVRFVQYMEQLLRTGRPLSRRPRPLRHILLKNVLPDAHLAPEGASRRASTPTAFHGLPRRASTPTAFHGLPLPSTAFLLPLTFHGLPGPSDLR